MKDPIKPYNILSDGNAPDEDKMLQYLRGELSKEEQYEMEQQFEQSIFEKEAYEGLTAIGDKDKLQDYVATINADLRKQLKTKKRKTRAVQPSLFWIFLAIFIILALLILGYIVIHFMSYPAA